MIIDFQSHVFPSRYIDELNAIDGTVILEPKDPYSGMIYFYDKEIKSRINTVTFQGQDPDRRIEHMNQLGIDIQIVSVPAPGADRFPPKEAVLLAKAANNSLADLCKRYPDRFVGLATLPTSSINDSLIELDRAVNVLGLKGFGCFTNLNGKGLDREELFPIYEKLAELKLPVYLHPTAPICTEMLDLDIMPILIYGWAFDSTVAMTRLVYGRVLERFPEINFVVADVGGVLSFFGQRATNIYSGRTEEIRKRYGLKENPLDSFRRFYVDTADHSAITLRCVLEFFGPDKLVFGTNYPYGPNEGCRFVENSLRAIDELGLTKEEKDGILGSIAARIIGVPTR